MTNLFSYEKWEKYLIYFSNLKLFLDPLSLLFEFPAKSDQSDFRTKEKSEIEKQIKW